MAKQADKKQRAEADEDLASQLTKAQLRLRVAEEKAAQARERGKQEVEKARLRAARWMAKAAARIERRAEAVARLEARVAADEEPAETELVSANGAVPGNGTAELVVVGLNDRETRAYRALLQIGQDGGASPGDWLRASEMAPTTFRRARQGLLARGLVTRQGDEGADARYVPSDQGEAE